jgi:hypothetical protein
MSKASNAHMVEHRPLTELNVLTAQTLAMALSPDGAINALYGPAAVNKYPLSIHICTASLNPEIGTIASFGVFWSWHDTRNCGRRIAASATTLSQAVMQLHMNSLFRAV